jgi:hypothetical protein
MECVTRPNSNHAIMILRVELYGRDHKGGVIGSMPYLL